MGDRQRQHARPRARLPRLGSLPPRLEGADPEREQRADFIEDLRRFLAIHVQPEQRPDDLRQLPRRREVVGSTSVGIGRIVDHAYKASWLGWAMLRGKIETPEQGLAELFGREGKRSHTSEAIRKAKMRKWARRVPVLHLAMPLVREMLGPPPGQPVTPALSVGLIGQRLSRMVIDPAWVTPALAEASHWRLRLPLELDGLKVDDFLAVRPVLCAGGGNLSGDEGAEV